MSVLKSPPWKQAVDDFFIAGFKSGDVLTRDWLMTHFGLQEPETVPEYRKFEVKFLSSFDAFRRVLLEQHLMDLQNIYGTGAYQVVPSHQQTPAAMNDLHLDMRKAIKKAAKRVRFVDHEQLDDSQRRANADAQAKVCSLASILKPKKWLKNSVESS